jgi:hypothetical protein
MKRAPARTALLIASIILPREEACPHADIPLDVRRGDAASAVGDGGGAAEREREADCAEEIVRAILGAHAAMVLAEGHAARDPRVYAVLAAGLLILLCIALV